MKFPNIFRNKFLESDPILASAEDCTMYQFIQERKKSRTNKHGVDINNIIPLLILFLILLKFLVTFSSFVFFGLMFLLIAVQRLGPKTLFLNGKQIYLNTLEITWLGQDLWLSGLRGRDILRVVYIENMKDVVSFIRTMFVFVVVVLLAVTLFLMQMPVFHKVFFLASQIIFLYVLHLVAIFVCNRIVISNLSKMSTRWLGNLPKKNFVGHYTKLILIALLATPTLIALLLILVYMIVNFSFTNLLAVRLFFGSLFISAVMYPIYRIFAVYQAEKMEALFRRADLALDYSIQYLWNGEENPQFIEAFLRGEIPESISDMEDADQQ